MLVIILYGYIGCVKSIGVTGVGWGGGQSPNFHDPGDGQSFVLPTVLQNIHRIFSLSASSFNTELIYVSIYYIQLTLYTLAYRVSDVICVGASYNWGYNSVTPPVSFSTIFFFINCSPNPIFFCHTRLIAMKYIQKYQFNK